MLATLLVFATWTAFIYFLQRSSSEIRVSLPTHFNGVRQTSATSKDAPKCSLYVKLGQEHDEEFPWGFRKRRRHTRKQKVFFNQSILGYWRHETAGTSTSFLLHHSHWFQRHRTNLKHFYFLLFHFGNGFLFCEDDCRRNILFSYENILTFD